MSRAAFRGEVKFRFIVHRRAFGSRPLTPFSAPFSTPPKVLAQKGVISELDGKRSAHDEEMQKIFDDQQRLRENMKALKGSAEEKALLQRYTQQLNGQENRLEALRKEGEQLATQRASAQEVLDKMVQELSFDEKL